MSEGHKILPVWFFIGITLLFYGIIIFAAGINGLWHPPTTVLSELHSGVWWGILLTVIGGVYVVHFWPRRS